MATALNTTAIELDETVAANDGINIESDAQIMIEHSDIKANGVRAVTREGLSKVLSSHGVTDADFRKVQKAVDHAASVAGHVATLDLEDKIKGMSADDLADPAIRQGLESVVRLPTHGGSTEVWITGETPNRPAPGRQGDQTDLGVSYGKIKMKVNTTGRITKDLHAQAQSRIAAALGQSDTAD